MNNDLISRQTAKDALAKLVPYAICDTSTESYTNGLTDAYNLICRLPPAQPEQRWAPISERLPEEKINPNTSDFEEVLCSTTFGDVRAYKFGTPLGWKEPHFWNGPGMMDEYVLAWMPLPKPWRGEEE